jgi:glycosyltransferase involved in cell wall biosynthesis
MKVFAVIPAYNEEKTIGQVVFDVKKHVDGVIVVDDGSVDRTAALAREAGASVASHFLNRGQGAALETGKAAALGFGADIIVTYDADGQFVPEEISNITRPIIDNQADVVLGSRFLKSDIPLSKKIF